MGTRITRKTAKIFASNAGGSGVAEFGSTANGTTVYTTDPDVIQSSEFEEGLAGGIIAGSKRLPVYEEINGVYYVGTRQIAYLLQEGIPEWDAGTEYFAKSIVRKSGTYELYGSVGNNNQNNALPSAVSNGNWTYLGDLSTIASGGAPFVDTTAIVKGSSDPTKLVRLEADLLTSATTRVLTVQDKDGTIALLSDTPVYYSSISGFRPTAISGSSTTGAVTISAGQATSSANTSLLAGSGYSWAVSNGNAANGYQGGSTLPNSSTIHFYAIATATDTTWSASFASTSLTPTLPGSYTKYRRLFSLNTNSSGALLPVTAIEVAGGALQSYLTTPVLDVNVSNLSTSRVLYTLSVPSGVAVQPLTKSFVSKSGADVFFILQSPSETDSAPQGNVSPLYSYYAYNTITSGATSGAEPLLTNTSGQLAARSSAASTTFILVTSGWIDFRR